MQYKNCQTTFHSLPTREHWQVYFSSVKYSVHLSSWSQFLKKNKSYLSVSRLFVSCIKYYDQSLLLFFWKPPNIHISVSWAVSRLQPLRLTSPYLFLLTWRRVHERPYLEQVFSLTVLLKHGSSTCRTAA